MEAVTRTSCSLMTFPVVVCYNDSAVPLVIIKRNTSGSSSVDSFQNK